MTVPSEPLRGRVHSLAGGIPRTFWVLCAGMFVNRAGTFVVPFLAVYLTQVRGFSAATAGVVAALYGAGAMVASALGGFLADHVGRRATLVGALTLGGIGMIALGFARDIRTIAAMTFLVAMLGEAYRPAVQAAVADLVPAGDRVRAFGLLYWVINLGYSAGVSVGGALASVSFLLLFVGDGVTSLLFALIAWRAVPETRPAPHPSAPPGGHGFVRGFLAPYRDGPFGLFIVLSIMVLLVFTQFTAALPIGMSLRGVSRAWLGLVLGVNGVVIVLLQPFVAPHAQRWNRSYALAAGSTLIGLGFGLNAIAHGPALFGVGVLVWTLGEILALPMGNAVVADVAPSDLRGRYQGAYGLCFGLAAFVSPLIGTAVMQRFGGATLWMGCLVLGVVAAAGHVLLAPRLTRLREQRSAARAGA